MLKLPALRKVILHYRGPEHPDLMSNRTSAAHLRHLAFEARVVCNQLPDEARRDRLSSFRTVVGLTDAEIVSCDSFGTAVALAKPVLEEMRKDVLESLAGVQRTRVAEMVVRGASDLKRPTADGFDLSIVRNCSTTLMDLRVESFMHRLTTDGLRVAARAGLLVSCSGIQRNFPAVNAALAAAGLAEFSNVDTLYTFVTLAIRCEELDDYMAQFGIAFCEYAENKFDNDAQTFDRDELIQQVSDSKAVSDGMKADVFLLSRVPVLALLERQEYLKPAAFLGVTICLRTALWFSPQHVVLPTATFSVGDVRKRLSEAPTNVGPSPGRTTFAHALLSLFAEAISGWLHRYFDEYGADPWKGDFRAKWATASAVDPLSFYLCLYNSLFASGSVALWCGLPLRVWVAGDGDAVIHEFFPRRKENITALLASMPRKTAVSGCWP
jgi:hypothetical protein